MSIGKEYWDEVVRIALDVKRSLPDPNDESLRVVEITKEVNTSRFVQDRNLNAAVLEVTRNPPMEEDVESYVSVGVYEDPDQAAAFLAMDHDVWEAIKVFDRRGLPASGRTEENGMAMGDSKEWSPKYRKFTDKEILDAANEDYPDGFLGLYYDRQGKRQKGSGDLLGEWIVNEIFDSIDDEKRDRGIIDLAIRRLNTGKNDIDRAIKGLEDLRKKAGR